MLVPDGNELLRDGRQVLHYFLFVVDALGACGHGLGDETALDENVVLLVLSIDLLVDLAISLLPVGHYELNNLLKEGVGPSADAAGVGGRLPPAGRLNEWMAGARSLTSSCSSVGRALGC